MKTIDTYNFNPKLDIIVNEHILISRVTKTLTKNSLQYGTELQYQGKNIQQITIKSNCDVKITKRFHSFSHKHDAVHTTWCATSGVVEGSRAATPGDRVQGAVKRIF
jgi:hypothetical protein